MWTKGNRILKTTIMLREILRALGHEQPPTPIKSDNNTAVEFVKETLKVKKSKTWDMRYNWIRDREQQGQFYIYWEQGTNNYADYSTKHFPTSYHQQIRPTYILKGYHIQIRYYVRGCVNHIGKRLIMKSHNTYMIRAQCA